MNLDLNLIDELRDFPNQQHDDNVGGAGDVKYNVRQWVKERMIQVWEYPG